uniref:Uncharacterized protein n=1 Tax=Phlebotomus papatasi TaxID=29031 RepID=A0A1B0DA49_PHLPP
MSDFLPSNTMDNFANIESALDEKIRKFENNWGQDLDESWSQSTTSVQNSPQEVSLSPQGCSGTSQSPPGGQVGGETASPPWTTEVQQRPAEIILPQLNQQPRPAMATVQPITRSVPPPSLPANPEPAAFAEPVKKRSRTQFSTFQLVSLENAFTQSVYISRATRSSLARELNLTEKQIKIWFQNRRMKENKVIKGKVSGPNKPQNRLAASAVKNLQKLAEKQNDQNIVSRLMSQRQVAISQPSAFPNFASGEEVHQQYQPPPPYPAGSQIYQQEPRQQPLYPQDNFYDPPQQPFYRPDLHYDFQLPYSGFPDPAADHMMDYPPFVGGMLLNDMTNSTISWGNILDRQLTA